MKLVLFILFFTSLALTQGIKNNELIENNEQISSAGLIEKAYYKKEINLDQRVLYLVYYINDNSKLPNKFKSDAYEKCGTWIVKIIYNNIPKLNKETRQALQLYGFKELK